MVDIGAFGEEITSGDDDRSDPLLFEWQELNLLAQEREGQILHEHDEYTPVEFRAVKSQEDCHSQRHRPVTGPEDTLDLASGNIHNLLPHGFEYSRTANWRQEQKQLDSESSESD